MANFGVDSYRVTDRQTVSTLVTNPSILIGQRIVRAWQTAKGALAVIGDDPNFGLAGGGLVQYINKRLTPNEIAMAEANLTACAMRDEEVFSISVSVSFNNAGAMTISASGQSAAGPFSLTGNVNSITGEAVFNFLPGP